MAFDLTKHAQPFINRLFALLRVRPQIGGLEISDSAIRYAEFRGKEWRFSGLRLPPGIVEGGTIKDRMQFVAALNTLRLQVLGSPHSRETVNAVVSLSSINIYSQVFSLPMVEGENLEKAVQLNIQMISPDDIAKTYSGWQLVGEDQKSVRLEILSAFINRSVVDEVRSALHEAGFVVYSLESRALSLARTIRTLSTGFDATQSYVVLNLDSGGIQFLVIRRGHLYFEYFTSWKDVEIEGHQISSAIFDGVVSRNLHQVLNFYHAHWTDPVREILLSATGLRDEVAAIVTKSFDLPVRDVTLSTNQALSTDWFVVMGGGLRGFMPRRDDAELSLLGVSAQDEFRRHQFAHFLRFWRVAVPATLAVMIVAYAGVYLFLRRASADLASQLGTAIVSEDQRELLEALRQQIAKFNGLVRHITERQATLSLGSTALQPIIGPFERQNITISRFSFVGFDMPITVTARAPHDDAIKALKSALDQDPRFSGIDIPLTGIVRDAQGVSFRINFSLAAPKEE